MQKKKKYISNLTLKSIRDVVLFQEPEPPKDKI
jgi:hypothetical protein